MGSKIFKTCADLGRLAAMAAAMVASSLMSQTAIAKTPAERSASPRNEVVLDSAAQRSAGQVVPAMTPVETQPAQDSAAATAKTSEGANERDADRTLKIGGGDLLTIKVFGVPELSDDVRVSQQGEVSLALVGQVHVQGMTPEEAARAVEKQLVDGNFMRAPQVSVTIKEYVTQGISVMGEVSKPGVYPLLGARRLFDVISSAGGTTARAGKAVTITHRDTPDQPVIVVLSNDPVQASAANVAILPGDTVIVSKAGVVYVVGDVGRPSGFVMENNENLTVLQAIALAQGLNHSAALNNAKLIRKSPQGLKEIPIPLKKILEGKSADVAMQGEDILFVPASAGKNAARRTLEAVVQTATGVAIYRR